MTAVSRSFGLFHFDFLRSVAPRLYSVALLLCVPVFLSNPVQATVAMEQEVILSGGGNEWLGTPEEKAALNETSSRQREGQRLRRTGDLNGAEKAFKQALELDPCVRKQGHACASSFSDLGDIYFRKQMWKESVLYYHRHFNYALSVSGCGGRSGEALRYSVALIKTGAWQEAFRFYNLGMAKAEGTALVLDDRRLPDSADHGRLEAAARVAVAATELFDQKLVKEQCEKALLRLPDYAPAHYILGNYLSDAGKSEDAKREWNKAVQLSVAGSPMAEDAQKKLRGR